MRYLILIILFGLIACHSENSTSNVDYDPSAKVTLVELGSTNCYYCKAMDTVLNSLQERYAEIDLQIKIIDVVRDRKAAEPFIIRVMPTQVFLDVEGIEFHRHEGYYSEQGIDSVLKSKNIFPIK